MASKGRIKGSVFGPRVEELSKGLEDGSIDRSRFEQRFDAAERALLAKPTLDASWYDVALYGRLLEFLRDEIGGGKVDYLVGCGRATAERLLAAGIHQQFDYLKRTQHQKREAAEERSAAFGRDLRLLATITGSILDFAKTEIVADPEHPLRWMIVHSEADAFPDALCWSSQGFSSRMAEEHGDMNLWSWDRPSKGVVRFRMSKDV